MSPRITAAPRDAGRTSWAIRAPGAIAGELNSALGKRFASLFDEAGGVAVRSVIVIDVHRASDSCGYGVPFMDFESHRPTLDQWSRRKGPDGIREYWARENRVSIDELDGIDVE